jgi:L-ascorbate metabolism protein UlaG (beta-lactamase superfamily)
MTTAVRWRQLLLVAAVAVGLFGCGPRMSYPKSPQWRNGRFANPPEWPRFPTVREFFRWQAGRPQSFEEFTPRLVPNDGARLRQDRENLSITWIGHATLLVQGAGVSVLTDPVFVKRIGIFTRFAPPGVAQKDLPPIDFVVISHNHRDHLDEESVRALGPQVQYIVPLGLARWFRERGLARVVELDWWDGLDVTTDAGRTARITMVPAQHWSRRGLLDERESLWGGYVIELPTAERVDQAGLAHRGSRIYFAGDTGYPAAFAEIGRRFPDIDYALLPIGAYAPRWFMGPQHISPAEAARAFFEVGARTLIPMHYATFRLADEPMDDPPRLLRQAMGTEAVRIEELALGETHWQ